MTITFHLTHPDGAFLDIMAMPFAFAVPAGTPYKDISTDPQWRVATGPYMVKTYVPKQQIVLVRNPNFHAVVAQLARRAPERRDRSRSASRPSRR